MRGVLRLVPVDPAGHDHAHRRLGLLHDPRLHRRGVRAQDDLAGQIDDDRVPDIPRRVIARDVEQVEVVVPVSTSGPKTVWNPSRAKISLTSSIICETGCDVPTTAAGPAA